jgi:hypothetical protein
MTDQRQELFAKTAQLLRNLNSERLAVIRERDNAQEKVADAEKKDRAYALAKTAVTRGIIDDDFESVQSFVDDVLDSSRPFEVIEEATKMATSSAQFSVREVPEDETGTGGRRVDALTSLIMGSVIE